MPPAIEPNALQLVIGPIIIYFAPSPATFPTLTAAAPNDAAWTTAGFSRVGYTEDGASISSTPSTKDFIPDELITPAKTVITGVKAELKMTLWENTLENLERAVGLSLLTNPGTGIKTLGFGSGNVLKEYAIGLQTPGIGGPASRVYTIWRANSVSTIEQKYTRKDISKIACTFNLLTDSTKPTAQDVFGIVDFNAGS